MRKLLISLFTATVVTLALIASPSRAQIYVSPLHGDDSVHCGSQASPCLSFPAAIANSEAGGIIYCLDAGELFSITIQKSITIDCHANPGAIVNGQIFINFDAFDPSDTKKTVNLRSIALQGTINNFAGGIDINGAGTGSIVNLEDCLIDNYIIGILDNRTRGALTVSNSTVSNNQVFSSNNIGISVTSPGNGSRRATIEGTKIINYKVGLSAGTDTIIVLGHSLLSNNATAGLIVGTSGAASVDSTTIAHNGIGIQNSGTVAISNSDIKYNTTAISGSVSSFSNNRFVGNSAQGGSIIPVAQQ
jgi:hypothetical protein